MSSGINWMYRFSSGIQTQPPIQYLVGREWASGEVAEPAVIAHIHGLSAVRTAYARLPGLNGPRSLWLRASLSGPQLIANVAAQYALDVFARAQGKSSPLLPGCPRPETRTVAQFFEGKAFVCGCEIAAHGNIPLDGRFLDHWCALALAAEEWPQEKWGICSRVKGVEITVLNGLDERPATPAEREKALSLANDAAARPREG